MTPDHTIELDWLKRWSLYSPNHIALKEGETGREISYRSFYLKAARLANYLKSEWSLEKGQRVAVLATNEIEYVILYFALQRLGLILVPINYRLAPREINYITENCAPELLVYQSEYIDLLQQLKTPAKTVTFETLIEAMQSEGDLEENFAPQMLDLAMILYTSGTTGFPKGAMISYQTLFWNSVNTSLRLNLSQGDRTVTFLPFFHTGGWNVLTTPFIHRGAQLIFLKKFEATKILELCQNEKATILFGVPTTMNMMAQDSVFKNIDLSSLRYAIVGGEPMSLELIKVWAQKGIPIRQGYGLTEFGPNVFSLNEEDVIRKIGSIGFPNFYIEAKIVDNAGKVLGNNEVGELILKGPSVMVGYWNNPEATAQTIKDGWLYTGDLVRRDDEGYYYVVGRKKEMFISGGENVYPIEVEQVLRSHGAVKEVAVIGVKDDKWGEVGKAFIVLHSGSTSVDDIKEYCAKNLAKYKVPKYYQFLEDLPKGDSGKILKRELPDLS